MGRLGLLGLGRAEQPPPQTTVGETPVPGMNTTRRNMLQTTLISAQMEEWLEPKDAGRDAREMQARNAPGNAPAGKCQRS